MNKLLSKIVGAALGLTMAIGVGVAVGSNREATQVHAAAGDSPIILDGTNLGLSSTATTEDTEKTYGGVTYVVSTGAKTQSSTGTNKFSATAILIGKSGTYIYNKTAIPGEITKFEVYANKGASAKVSVGVNFSATAALTSWSSTTGTWTQTLSSLDHVYDASSKIVSGAKYFRYQVTNAYNSQVEFRITYTAQKYTVTYNANNATSGTVPTDSTQYTNGSTVTVKGNTGSLARTGYTFGGWNTRADGTGTNYAAGSGTFSISGNTTLYAKWTVEKYSVSAYIANGGFVGTTGANAATYGTAYNATITADSGYSLPTELTVTMGGSATSAYTYNSETGAFSVASPTGNIAITATCPYDGQTFAINVSVENGTYSGDSEIGEEGEASVTITPNSGYKVPLNKSDITVTNAIEWDYTRSSNSSATISLLGAGGAVSISAECVALESYSIGFTSEEHFTYSGPSSIQEDGSATLTIVPEEGYYQPSDVTVSGATKSWVQGTGALTLSNPTGDVSITYTPVERTLTGITISSSSGSFTLGDVFTKPTVTATYNVGGNVDVTNDATATGGGLVDGVLTEAGTKTITISYGGYSKTYTATVTAIEPSAGGLEKITKLSDLTVGSTVYLVCEGESKQLSGISTTSTKYGLGADYATAPSSTVYPLTVETGYSSGTYSFKNGDNYLNWSSGNSLSTNSTLSDNTSWTVTFNSSGNALLANKATPAREIWWNTGSPRFACYTDKTESSSGYAPVQLYKNYPAVEPELKWITAEVKSGTYYQGSSVTSDDFTVTAHYDDGNTSTPTTDITVTNGELVNIGTNEVTLTYGGKSCKVNVIAIEQTATLTGLAWAQGEYAIINGQGIDFSELGTITAEYDDGDSYATKSINQCSVATYTKSGSDYAKVTDLADGDTLTSTSHGKYLGISYTEGVVTKYAYSSAPIYVVEEINNVRRKEATTSWSKITSIKEGDVVTFVNETENVVSTSMGNNIINATSYSTSVSTTFTFTVGTVKVGDNTYYTFHNVNGYLGNHSTGTSGNNNAYLDTEIDTDNNMNYFTVSFDGDSNVTIKSVYATERTLQLRKGTPDRFCFYGSEQDPVQLYKSTNSYTPTGEPISNTNATAQKVALEYATHFVTEMNCKADGTTADVANKWSELATDFSNWFINSTSEDFKNLTSEQVAHAFELFEYADAVDGGDTLQNMLSKYEYIIGKYNKLGYGLEDFLHTNTDRPVVQSTSVRIGLFGIINSTNMTVIIIVISLVSLTAVGGYFFLRTRKED